MKIIKYITFSVLFLLISIQSIRAQTFVKKQGAATDIAISPKDGSVYVVGTSKNVFKYDTRSKAFKPFGKQSKNVKSIAVHPNGSLYMVSTSSEVYIDVNGRWNKIPGIKTNEVDIDKKGNVRALNLSGKLYKLFQGKWQLKSLVNKNTSGFNQLIGQDSKILYARFKNNNFKQFRSGKWLTLNGSPLKITVDDKTGDVYAVGRNKGIYKWNSTTNKWGLLKNTRKDFKDVAVNNGKIWATATNKSIYYYDKNKTLENLTPKDYSGTYRVTFTRILNYEQNATYGTMGVYLKTKSKSGQTISVMPKYGKTNRAWNISKTTPLRPIKKEVVIRQAQMIPEQFKYDIKLEYELEIDKIREFTLSADEANENTTFEFQFNVKKKKIIGEHGDWHSVKIKLKDLKLNYEYYSETKCFIIEKL